MKWSIVFSDPMKGESLEPSLLGCKALLMKVKYFKKKLGTHEANAVGRSGPPRGGRQSDARCIFIF